MKGFIKFNDDDTFFIQTPYHIKIKEALQSLGPMGWANDVKAYQFEKNKLDQLKTIFRNLGVSIEQIDSMPIKIYGVKIAYIKTENDKFKVFVPYLECLTKVFKTCDGAFDHKSYVWSFNIQHYDQIINEIKKLGITIDETNEIPAPKAPVIKVNNYFRH
jgi:hypothetical protein